MTDGDRPTATGQTNAAAEPTDAQESSGSSATVLINGITVITLPAGEHISPHLAETKAAEARTLAAGVPRPLLIDISGVLSIDRNARAVLGRAQMSTAVAILGSSPVDRVLANFVLGGQQPSCPVSFFASETEAVAWLASFLPVR